MPSCRHAEETAHLLGIDTDGCSIWCDPIDGMIYNSGEPLTADETAELRADGWDGTSQPWSLDDER